ncbi:M24 family metallopeptidase [Streptomyces rugosispiralis]|uniref:M24 family metallopeptidase n=1 Tax=Streptomyces rugosispiralis TaxID=2967341 RepID=A0ABT1URA2_9ACTN|nr:M24 family metallopeptidase [Streptomyces rugosispiralis]MCQ8187644.1 M24 family metallopeptidase [Streptomyces rugosispiralis]
MTTTVTCQAGTGLDRLREQLDKAGFAALLLTSPGARRYALGRTPGLADGTAVLLTTEGTMTSAAGDLPTAITAVLRAGGVADGVVGADADLPWEVFGQVSEAGVRLRPAADLVFTELASGEPGELPAVAAAVDLAAVGYTAVMDHLRVGMDVRELSGNVDRSIRRAGGLLGWYDPCGPYGTYNPYGPTGRAAGTDLVTVRGHDPGTARLTAGTPVRFVLHPLLDGVAGYAAATAVLGEPDGPLRAAGAACAAATASLLAALRPGAPLRDGCEAFDREAFDREAFDREAFGRETGEHAAACRIVALRGGGASLPLPRDSAVTAEPGMVLGIRTEVAVPGRGAVELAETVVLTDSGAEPQARTPLRLVELH